MCEKEQISVSKEVVIGGLIVAICLCISVVVVKVVSIHFFPVRSTGQGDILITPYITATSNGNYYDSDAIFLPGVFSLEMSVIVSGTENDGLRMRKNPGINEEILYLARENEILKIIDGPQIIGNQIWWGLISLDDPKKSGWSVQDYLEPLN